MAFVLSYLQQVTVSDDFFTIRCGFAEVSSTTDVNQQIIPPDPQRTSLYMTPLGDVSAGDPRIYIGDNVGSGGIYHLMPRELTDSRVSIKEKESPGLASSAIFAVFEHTAFQGSLECAFVGVSKHCSCIPHCCNDMAYTYKTSQITLTAGSNPVPICNANPLRVSMTLSAHIVSGSGVDLLLLYALPQAAYFAALVSPVTQIMPYRDWGPLIQSQIYAVANSVNQILAITEILRIPESK